MSKSMQKIMDEIAGRDQDKRMSIRIPLDLWKKLRELQTQGRIKSIQEACVEGLKKLTK